MQKALAAYLGTQSISFDPGIYTSILDDSAENPAVLVRCKRAQGRVTTEGNWVAHARVEVRENADDTDADDHHDHAGELFSLFRTDTIADDLSAALSEFTCFQVVVIEQGWDTDGRLWVSYLDLDLECCGSDIS